MSNDEKTPLLSSQRSTSNHHGPSVGFSNDHSAALTHVDIDGPSNGVSAVQLARRKSVDKIIPIALSWRDVNVHVEVAGKKSGCCGGGGSMPPTTKHILKNVTGVVRPGDLMAIMGASGAGKSTLLNVLTGRNTRGYNLTGDVRLNGWDLANSIRDVSAYVQQDDLFISTLSVREQLQFRALLRMDKSLNTQERLARVEEVIIEMGLSKCANTRIGDVGGGKKGISGGERKRLSFASEALTNPPIFFCDEPTSGLDTFMAQSIVQTLQGMASKGRTILCTIHQPSSELFSMFSQILLLAEGRTAFMGSTKDAITFFERLQFPCPQNYNPADHYILTLAIVPGREEECKAKTNAICDAYDRSDEAGASLSTIFELEKNALQNGHDILFDDVSAGESRYSASWLTQCRYLFWRSWISLFRDMLLFRVRVSQTLCVALILGLVYLRTELNQKGVMDFNGAIFLLITNTSFSNMFAVVNSFPLELGIFLREYGSGLYRVDVYYLAKTFAEIPLFLVLGTLFVTICYWMIGLYEQWDTYLIAVGILLLTANVAVSLGYLISTIAGSVNLALAVAPPLLIPFMLFGGLFLNSANIPVYFVWLEYLSWFKYANEILMVNQWKNVDYIPCDNGTMGNSTTTVSPKAMPPCAYKTGEDVLRYTSFDEDNVVTDIILMAALIVGFRLLSFIALYIRARRSKG